MRDGRCRACAGAQPHDAGIVAYDGRTRARSQSERESRAAENADLSAEAQVADELCAGGWSRSRVRRRRTPAACSVVAYDGRGHDRCAQREPRRRGGRAFGRSAGRRRAPRWGWSRPRSRRLAASLRMTRAGTARAAPPRSPTCRLRRRSPTCAALRDDRNRARAGVRRRRVRRTRSQPLAARLPRAGESLT